MYGVWWPAGDADSGGDIMIGRGWVLYSLTLLEKSPIFRNGSISKRLLSFYTNFTVWRKNFFFLKKEETLKNMGEKIATFPVWFNLLFVQSQARSPLQCNYKNHVQLWIKHFLPEAQPSPWQNKKPGSHLAKTLNPIAYKDSGCQI